MPPQEQADLWMALRDRMKVDWNEMTLQEKKAGKSTPPCMPNGSGSTCWRRRLGVPGNRRQHTR